MFKNKRSFFERITGSISSFNGGAETELSDRPVETTNGHSDPSWLKGEGEEGELAVDVFQTPVEIVIKAMISGVRPEDLNISITREMVTIKGKREETETVAGTDYFHQELYWGSFSKTILLPSEVEPEEAEAVERHGLLTIRLPKVDRSRIQRLKVRSV
jgi:HSP20 family molecular chaperone IbpA